MSFKILWPYMDGTVDVANQKYLGIIRNVIAR